MSSKKIKNLLKKHHPDIAKKSKKLFGIKYPKLIILILSIILSFIVFRNPTISGYIVSLGKLNSLGMFLGGMLSSFGFSAPFAIGFFIVSHPQNILLATVIGTSGAVISDVLIFKVIKISFLDEFEELERTKTLHKIKKIVDKNIALKIRHYLMYLFAGIMIVTPLPDEIGVSMIAGLTTIKQRVLGVASFALHFTALYLIFIASSV
jgi:hypothetical protein